MAFSSDEITSLKGRIDSALERRQLDTWQRRFLIDIKARFDRYGTRTRLSEKQTLKLREIVQGGQTRIMRRHRAGSASFGPLATFLVGQTRWIVYRFVRDATIVAAIVTGFAGYAYFSSSGFNWADLKSTFGQTTPLVSGTYFPRCGRPPHVNCVIDGDTFYLDRQSIRVADIDTPETNPPRCAQEAELGARATQRFIALLNNGPFEVRPWRDRDEDQFGRKLRTVHRDGSSLGLILVTEGLAREWSGSRLPWCD